MKSRLASIGAYGFGKVETAIFAALVSEDPLLLIGRSGTGKTHLLNTLSEALELEHRHYNASLVSFDDLVGFPFPEEDKGGVRFLETPATVWPAESVLVDEISRCKPEHQNRLFSLVHERRIQGIALPKLRYRWAAMNPCSLDEGGDYAGSEPLDRALADRFGLIVEVVDWNDLTDDEQRLVADPSGEGRITDPNTDLRRKVADWRRKFNAMVANCPAHIVEYARIATTALNTAGLRVSPRRARMISRSLLAAEIVAGRKERVYKLILKRSLPQPAWGQKVSPEHVAAAHRTAWACIVADEKQRWTHTFHLEGRLDRKLGLLLRSCPDPETGTLAVCQFLATDDKLNAGAFAMAVYPAALEGRLPLNAEAVADLARMATPILDIDAEITWQEALNVQNSVHPGFAKVAPFLNTLSRGRRERATQLLYWALTQGLPLDEPEKIEVEFDRCVRLLRRAR